MLVTGEIPKAPPAQRQFAERPKLELHPSVNPDMTYAQFEKEAKKVLVESEIPAAASAFRNPTVAGEDGTCATLNFNGGRPGMRATSMRPLDYYTLTRNGWNELSSVLVDRLRCEAIEKTMG